MTKQQEFRKQTEEAKFEAFSLMCKKVAELEEKISVLLSCKNCPENKGGLICVKEYENKCLAQKIEYIKELQQENEVLKGRTEGFEKQILGLLYKYESVYKRFPDLKSAMDKAEEVLKENAELKEQLESERDLPAIAYMQGAEKQKKKDEEELKKWKDEWQEQVQKATDEGYARTLQTIQLNKAKKILQKVVADFHNMDCVTVHINKTITEAEQFLKEE